MIFSDQKLEGRVVLAPLAGVSDSSFRSICRNMGAAIVFTEMISADGLLQKNYRTFDYLFFRDNERPIGFQLFGSEPDTLARAVEIVEQYQPDFIDLNFGCPVKKVVKRDAGVALLKNIGRLEKITKAVVRHASKPVFAKIRKGWDEKHTNALEVAKLLEQCGVNAITIHPRTQAQGYRGRSDWQTIKLIKESVSIPIIGSGDVRSAEDSRRMIDETGCDLVMIGRGSLGNPWIFKQADHFLKTGKKLSPPSVKEKLAIILNHLQDIILIKGEKRGLQEIRKHLGWYTKGLPNSAKIRAELFRLKNKDEIKTCLTKYLDDMEIYG
ncbi:MAG: tRNA dihydrouridine synthase DusB [bacterium]|nr:MAG: tRNA dihydrouridine synthase DusB [bacterium]